MKLDKINLLKLNYAFYKVALITRI